MPRNFLSPLALLFALVLWQAATAAAAIIPDHYIVELDTPPVSAQVLPRGGYTHAARARMSAPAAVTLRTRIRGEQAQMKTRLEGRRARVLGSVDTLANAMFVELAGDNARAQLAALPGVKRVTPMREFHRVMDSAVLLHKVADAWAQIGGDRAGEGIKVAIIDTGVEVNHPALEAHGLTAPEGFPRANSEADLANTSGKVIVARSYVSLLSRRDPDGSARDRVGHGTALATIVAGGRTAGPLATITGVAPRAWIGSYKIFGSPNSNDSTNDAAVLKAIEDAVADGMDVINLSIGSDFAPRLTEDLEVEAIENASRAGVLVVVAAGNNGPTLNTLASPGTAPSAITVGAVTNARTFAGSLEASGLGTILAVAGSGPAPGAPITATVADVAALDDNGLGCDAYRPEALSGRIALIQRGTCTFEIKLNNAQRAGAVAAVVYTREDAPEPFMMTVGAATLPAEMIAFDNGLAIKKLLEDGERVGTLSFTPGPVPVAANRRGRFSAAGPNVDLGIKPDMTAAGVDIYTGTQRLDPTGDMFSADGFVQVDGTSFSAPIVAGAAALLKSARPGLTVEQYRSLLINNTMDAYTPAGELAGIQAVGSGSLNALAAINATAVASPTSLSFGSAGSDVSMRRTLTLTNLGADEETFLIEAAARSEGDPVPVAEAVSVSAGGTTQTPVILNAEGLAPGTHEGLLLVRSASTGTVIRVPYWYSVASPTPAAFGVISASTTGRAGRIVNDAVLFRVLDSSGVNIAGAQPEATVVAGDGTIRSVDNYDHEIPGLWGVSLRLGPAAGLNTIRIQAGEISLTVNIAGQ